MQTRSNSILWIGMNSPVAATAAKNRYFVSKTIQTILAPTNTEQIWNYLRTHNHTTCILILLAETFRDQNELIETIQSLRAPHALVDSIPRVYVLFVGKKTTKQFDARAIFETDVQGVFVGDITQARFVQRWIQENILPETEKEFVSMSQKKSLEREFIPPSQSPKKTSPQIPTEDSSPERRTGSGLERHEFVPSEKDPERYKHRYPSMHTEKFILEGTTIFLTPLQGAILRLLIQNEGVVVRRFNLALLINTDLNKVSTYVRNLIQKLKREKCSAFANRITFLPSIGYRLERRK